MQLTRSKVKITEFFILKTTYNKVEKLVAIKALMIKNLNNFIKYSCKVNLISCNYIETICCN